MGRGVPQLKSNKEQLADELKALQLLKSNGLVSTSVVKKENSVLFEIIDEKLSKANNEQSNNNSSLPPIKRIPPRFIKDKEKPSLTSEQIAEKLERANQRKMVNINNFKMIKN